MAVPQQDEILNRKPVRSRWFAARVVLVSFLAITLLVVAYSFVGFEGYCYLYPSIDTRYATGYSEEAFLKITNGMTKAIVESTAGRPLCVENYPNGQTWWHYTGDGKCTWADFAWLMRAVIFQTGQVVEVKREIVHN